MRFQRNIYVIWWIESNIRALVLFIINYWQASHFISTRLINSIKHEHSCMILYVFHFWKEALSLANMFLRGSYFEKSY